VSDRTGRLVVADDDATFGDGEVSGAHGRGEDAIVEQAAAGAEHDRNVIRRKRSTSSCRNNVWSRLPLPQICSSSPGSFFNARTAATTSPDTR